MATQEKGETIHLHLDHTPDTFICGKDLVPVSPAPVVELIQFFEAVPEADVIYMTWDAGNGVAGTIATRYFAFVENHGDGNFWFQLQWFTDGERVWDRRMRIKLEMTEHNRQKHQWQVEYSAGETGPEEPGDDGVLESVLVLARRQLERQVFVGSEELRKRREFSRAMSMPPAHQFAVPAVYRN